MTLNSNEPEPRNELSVYVDKIRDMVANLLREVFPHPNYDKKIEKAQIYIMANIRQGLETAIKAESYIAAKAVQNQMIGILVSVAKQSGGEFRLKEEFRDVKSGESLSITKDEKTKEVIYKAVKNEKPADPQPETLKKDL